MILPVPYLPAATAMAPFPGLVLVNWFKWRKLDRNAKLALIAHEWFHWQQQKEDGRLRFLLRWIFNKRWREVYEMEADLEQRDVYWKLER